MCSANSFKYLINIWFEMTFSRILKSDFNVLFLIHSKISRLAVFLVSQKLMKKRFFYTFFDSDSKNKFESFCHIMWIIFWEKITIIIVSIGSNENNKYFWYYSVSFRVYFLRFRQLNNTKLPLNNDHLSTTAIFFVF